MKNEAAVERMPVRAAAIAALAVLAGYLITLAPTVTFWDAGELIAAAYDLGIPHPPGTPLYVMLGHVWGSIIPFGNPAWRLNLLSAVCGAVAAGCWFLVAHSFSVRVFRDVPAWLHSAVGGAAAVLASFNFTTWQNAVEAEVYAVAMVTIALASCTVMAWRSRRSGAGSGRLLLVLFFLGAISIGNHLLALLVGPALIAMLVAEHLTAPPSEWTDGVVERSRILLLATGWLLMIAVGLGSTRLMIATGALFAAASVNALTRRQAGFLATALILMVIGVSTYGFLYLRAQQAPFINEADPSTWQALLDVIRRAQYPIRTPLDDPTIPHGDGNPGRTLAILGYQLANYAQYFDWQWARSLGNGALTEGPRLAITMAAAWLGLRGAGVQWRQDRSGWWFMATFIAVTGIGLVLYMNFKPGPSIGWDRWGSLGQHEVRERDYFFVASFVGWAVWMALGLGSVASRMLERPSGGVAWARALMAAALLPFVLNFADASRRHGADATLARDFSRALLNSVPPGGILFTWGDNDTFPLWHAQVVDGIRPDVIIVCLALAETEWYQRQLREHRPSAANPATLPAVWRGHPVPDHRLPIHGLDDATIWSLRPQRTERDYELPLPGGGTMQLPAGTVLARKDLLMLSVVQQNAGARPISWALTTAHRTFGAPVVQQGMTMTIPYGDVIDPEALYLEDDRIPPIDIVTTRRLIDETWDFGVLMTRDVAALDPTIRAMAATIAAPFAQIGLALAQGGDISGNRYLRQAAHLLPGRFELTSLLLRP